MLVRKEAAQCYDAFGALEVGAVIKQLFISICNILEERELCGC